MHDGRPRTTDQWLVEQRTGLAVLLLDDAVAVDDENGTGQGFQQLGQVPAKLFFLEQLLEPGGLLLL